MKSSYTAWYWKFGGGSALLGVLLFKRRLRVVPFVQPIVLHRTGDYLATSQLHTRYFYNDDVCYIEEEPR